MLVAYADRAHAQGSERSLKNFRSLPKKSEHTHTINLPLFRACYTTTQRITFRSTFQTCAANLFREAGAASAFAGRGRGLVRAASSRAIPRLTPAMCSWLSQI